MYTLSPYAHKDKLTYLEIVMYYCIKKNNDVKTAVP